jgi:hypothetical protein
LRPEKAEPYRQQILELLGPCKGNLVRVQEELAERGPRTGKTLPCGAEPSLAARSLSTGRYRGSGGHAKVGNLAKQV